MRHSWQVFFFSPWKAVLVDSLTASMWPIYWKCLKANLSFVTVKFCIFWCFKKVGWYNEVIKNGFHTDSFALTSVRCVTKAFNSHRFLRYIYWVQSYKKIWNCILWSLLLNQSMSIFLSIITNLFKQKLF